MISSSAVAGPSTARPPSTAGVGDARRAKESSRTAKRRTGSTMASPMLGNMGQASPVDARFRSDVPGKQHEPITQQPHPFASAFYTLQHEEGKSASPLSPQFPVAFSPVTPISPQFAISPPPLPLARSANSGARLPSTVIPAESSRRSSRRSQAPQASIQHQQPQLDQWSKPTSNNSLASTTSTGSGSSDHTITTLQTPHSKPDQRALAPVRVAGESPSGMRMTTSSNASPTPNTLMKGAAAGESPSRRPGSGHELQGSPTRTRAVSSSMADSLSRDKTTRGISTPPLSGGSRGPAGAAPPLVRLPLPPTPPNQLLRERERERERSASMRPSMEGSRQRLPPPPLNLKNGNGHTTRLSEDWVNVSIDGEQVPVQPNPGPRMSQRQAPPPPSQPNGSSSPALGSPAIVRSPRDRKQPLPQQQQQQPRMVPLKGSTGPAEVMAAGARPSLDRAHTDPLSPSRASSSSDHHGSSRIRSSLDQLRSGSESPSTRSTESLTRHRQSAMSTPPQATMDAAAKGGKKMGLFGRKASTPPMPLLRGRKSEDALREDGSQAKRAQSTAPARVASDDRAREIMGRMSEDAPRSAKRRPSFDALLGRRPSVDALRAGPGGVMYQLPTQPPSARDGQAAQREAQRGLGVGVPPPPPIPEDGRKSPGLSLRKSSGALKALFGRGTGAKGKSSVPPMPSLEDRRAFSTGNVLNGASGTKQGRPSTSSMEGRPVTPVSQAAGRSSMSTERDRPSMQMRNASSSGYDLPPHPRQSAPDRALPAAPPASASPRPSQVPTPMTPEGISAGGSPGLTPSTSLPYLSSPIAVMRSAAAEPQSRPERGPSASPAASTSSSSTARPPVAHTAYAEPYVTAPSSEGHGDMEERASSSSSGSDGDSPGYVPPSKSLHLLSLPDLDLDFDVSFDQVGKSPSTPKKSPRRSPRSPRTPAGGSPRRTNSSHGSPPAGSSSGLTVLGLPQPQVRPKAERRRSKSYDGTGAGPGGDESWMTGARFFTSSSSNSAPILSKQLSEPLPPLSATGPAGGVAMSRGAGASSNSQHAHSGSFASSSAHSRPGSSDHAETPSEASSTATTDDSATHSVSSPRTPPLDIDPATDGADSTDLTAKYQAAFGSPPLALPDEERGLQPPADIARAVTPVLQNVADGQANPPFTPPAQPARSGRANYGPSTPAARVKKSSRTEPTSGPARTSPKSQTVSLPRRGSPKRADEPIPPVPAVEPVLASMAKPQGVIKSSAKLMAATSASSTVRQPKTISPPAKPLTSLVSWTPAPPVVPAAVLSVIKAPSAPEPRIQAKQADTALIMPHPRPKELLSRSKTLAAEETRAIPMFRRDLEKTLHEYRYPSAGVTSAERANMIRSDLLPQLRELSKRPYNPQEETANAPLRDVCFDWADMLLWELRLDQAANERGACLEGLAGILESVCLSEQALKRSPVHQKKFTALMVKSMDFVMSKLGAKGVFHNTLLFSGRFLAFAFFRVPHVAEQLVTVLQPPRGAMMRFTRAVLTGATTPAEAQPQYPAHLAPLAFDNSRAYTARLASLSPEFANEEEASAFLFQPGNWLRRWQSDDSELFPAFYRSYHINLARCLAPAIEYYEARNEPLPAALLLRAPGYAHLATIFARKCHSYILGSINAVTTSSSTQNFEATETAGFRGSQKPAVLETANRRLVETFLSFANLRVQLPSKDGSTIIEADGTQLWSDMIDTWMKDLVGKTSLYAPKGVFSLFDLLDGIVDPPMETVHATPAERSPLSLLDTRYLIHVIRMVLTQGEHALTIVKVIAFMFTHWEVLTARPEDRQELCLGVLLHKELFERLLLFWSQSVRSYVVRLVVFRLGHLHTKKEDGVAHEVEIESVKLLQTRLDRIKRRHDELEPLVNAAIAGANDSTDLADVSAALDRPVTPVNGTPRQGGEGSLTRSRSTITMVAESPRSAPSNKAERLLGLGFGAMDTNGSSRIEDGAATAASGSGGKKKMGWFKKLGGGGSTGAKKSKKNKDGNQDASPATSSIYSSSPGRSPSPSPQPTYGSPAQRNSPLQPSPNVGGATGASPSFMRYTSKLTPSGLSTQSHLSPEVDSPTVSSESGGGSSPTTGSRRGAPPQITTTSPQLSDDPVFGTLPAAGDKASAPPAAAAGFAFEFELPTASPRSDTFDPAPINPLMPTSPHRSSLPPSPRQPQSPHMSRSFSKRSSLLPPDTAKALEGIMAAAENPPAGAQSPKTPSPVRAAELARIEEEAQNKGYDKKLHAYAIRMLAELEDAQKEYDEWWSETGVGRMDGAPPRLTVAWPFHDGDD